jgi:hypothetical protein
MWSTINEDMCHFAEKDREFNAILGNGTKIPT